LKVTEESEEASGLAAG